MVFYTIGAINRCDVTRYKAMTNYAHSPYIHAFALFLIVMVTANPIQDDGIYESLSSL